MGAYYLAVDIGASSGRHILAHLENGKLQLEEVHRFYNGMSEKDGELCWDFVTLFKEIKAGLKKCKELNKIPVSIGIDTWGVDYALLDERCQKLSKRFENAVSVKVTAPGGTDILVPVENRKPQQLFHILSPSRAPSRHKG